MKRLVNARSQQSSVDINNNNVTSIESCCSKSCSSLEKSTESPVWHNWMLRLIFGCIMISSFSFIVYLGPFAMLALILFIQFKCFQELIDIGHKQLAYESRGFKPLKLIGWFYLCILDFGILADLAVDKSYFSMTSRLWPLIAYRRTICFVLYAVGFVAYVVRYAVKLTYEFHFRYDFFFVYILLAVLVSEAANGLMLAVLEGSIWFIVPVSLIIFNDIMAYAFGFFFGRTPLIDVSPKKTWEGFVGSAICTVFFGLALSYLACDYEFLVCPLLEVSSPCHHHELFCSRNQFVVPVLNATMFASPFQVHALVFSFIVSLLGPFGGFFASGFKRAFNIKDFSNAIPGHGGFLDRFDCQYIVSAFLYVYIRTFVRSPMPNNLYDQFLQLNNQEKLQFVHLLNQTSSQSAQIIQ